MMVLLIRIHLHCCPSVLCWRGQIRQVGNGSERTNTTRPSGSRSVEILENSHGRIGVTGAVKGGLLNLVLCRRGNRRSRQDEVWPTACRCLRCFDGANRPWQLRGRDTNAITRREASGECVGIAWIQWFRNDRALVGTHACPPPFGLVMDSIHAPVRSQVYRPVGVRSYRSRVASVCSISL